MLGGLWLLSGWLLNGLWWLLNRLFRSDQLIGRNWQLLLLVSQAQIDEVHFVYGHLVGDLLVFRLLVTFRILALVLLSSCLLFLSTQLSGTFALLFGLFLLLFLRQFGTVFGQLSEGREPRLESS